MTDKFGLDRELAAKQDAKYDADLEEQARLFICSKTGADIPPGKGCLKQLKDGVVLCQLINTLQPGSVKKINTMKMPFMQMENISNYLSACSKYGIRTSELFQTVDLFEEANMSAVVFNLLAVARQSGHAVQQTNKGNNAPAAYSVAEAAYKPPPPGAGSGAGGSEGERKWKTSGVVPLMQAGAAAAGKKATAGAFGTGRRDIKAYGDDVKHDNSVVPLMQAGAAKAGAEATAGAFGTGRRDIKTYDDSVTQSNAPTLLSDGAARAGKAAMAGSGPGIGNDINTQAHVNFGSKGQAS